MTDLFFYLFSTLTLAAAILVVTSRNAVNSAMFLIVTFLGMASLFVLLESYFLAVIQVLVYAGAVVVLFLFIIMLLDVKGATVRPRLWTIVSSGLAGVLLLAGLTVMLKRAGLDVTAAAGPGVGSNLKAFGVELFTTYLLPMQVTGFLLLVAMIGVIVLSKRFEQPVGGKSVAALERSDNVATFSPDGSNAAAPEVAKEVVR
jgi:NADH-quinone oxidoreductase subunit J